MVQPVPLIVLSARQDDVELVNRTLRDGGHAVRCHWVTKADALADAIDEANPQLICFFSDSVPVPIRQIAKIKQQASRNVPLVVVRQAAEEPDIAEALAAGAQDLVSSGQTERLRSVAERELRAFRLERALNETLVSANQYKKQLKAFMAGSIDAIAYVQEGILVDTNQAWAELFGRERSDDFLGAPLMDFVEASSHAALKGALVACMKGQWRSGALKVAAKGKDGVLPLEVALEPTAVDGEPAVKLTVPRPKAVEREPEELVEHAAHKDPTTGFYHRRRFLELLTDRLDATAHSGVHALAYVRVDKFREIEEQIGPIASEDVLVQLAELLGMLAQPQDLCGRFGGQVFTLFLERATLREIETWARNAIARIAAHVFHTAHHTLSVTCTVGLAEVGPATDRLEALIAGASRSNRTGRQSGGNRVVIEETSDQSTRVQRFDAIWVQRIKMALMENRFKLLHLPVASLSGKHKTMYDTLVRMIDIDGQETAASEFMAAATRNRLLRSIDRWVIGASLTHCARTPLDHLFVKLSVESLLDKTLTDWLDKAVVSAGVSPAKLCFQVTEENASHYLTQTQELANKLKASGYGFAIEHFGVGRDSGRLLQQTPMDFLKLDGSLMQSLPNDQIQQEKVRAFINAAGARGVLTIAERVEDANTMAVLFQLGVAYMQGHYLHEPEVVLADVPLAVATQG